LACFDELISEFPLLEICSPSGKRFAERLAVKGIFSCSDLMKGVSEDQMAEGAYPDGSRDPIKQRT
jgi:hypothetical protein